MANYIEAKVTYEKTQEDGTQKKVTESYLVDALTFTEAEAKITEEMSAFISGEFSVSAVKKYKIAELFGSEAADADRYFKAKLAFITIDEKTMTEKRSNTYYLIQAGSLRKALDRIDQEMNRTMIDYVITQISETPIMDVFKH